MDLKTLKKNMGKLKSVSQKLKDQQASKKRKVDKRFYKPTKDANGNIYAVLRFLPQLDFDKVTYMQKYYHFIKKGKVFACACSNERDKCPVCQHANILWNEGYYPELELNGGNREHIDVITARDAAIEFSNMETTVTNVYVKKDKHNPEVEGQVFLYNMPKRVLEKYQQKLGMAIEGEEDEDSINDPVMVFHPFEGRDFQLRGKTEKVGSGSFIKYDKSEFAESDSPIDADEEKTLSILNQSHDLDAYLAEDTPDYDEIGTDFDKFLEFLGEKKPAPEKKKKVEESVEEPDDEDMEEMPGDDFSVDDSGDLNDEDLAELFGTK